MSALTKIYERTHELSTIRRGMSLGITTIELPGVSSDDLQRRLHEHHQILTQAMTDNSRAPEIRGLRITPNVYTTLAELDRLISALRRIPWR
jgi:selenocysteine lyase/cysteine desulfurase